MSFEVVTEAFHNVTYDGSFVYEMERFLNFSIDNLFRVPIEIEISCAIDTFIKELCEIVGKPLAKTIPMKSETLVCFENFLVVVPNGLDSFESDKRNLVLNITGEMGNVREIHEKLKKNYARSKKNNVDWFYSSENKVTRTTVNLEHKNIVKDEFYPWIKSGVAKFQQDFIDSDANVLLLVGEPGCGKTSFLRDLISRNNLSAAVTYDEELMNKDSFFIEFMNGNYDLLVIEDADVILRDRNSGNKIMNKLLNASDGLIQTKKKIIFTANISRLDEVDPALIRPGRCYEAMVFRELTYNEACIAAKAANLPKPEANMTLSELFSKGHTANVKPHIGFAVG